MQNGEAVCSFGKLSSGATQVATLRLAGRRPPSATSCANCMTTDATWLIKEGKPTNDNEAFQTDVVTASLLGGDGSQETKQAGGYETESASCTAATGNLHTNQALSAVNPVSTTVCLPAFTIPQGSLDLGLASLDRRELDATSTPVGTRSSVSPTSASRRWVRTAVPRTRRRTSPRRSRRSSSGSTTGAHDP